MPRAAQHRRTAGRILAALLFCALTLAPAAPSALAAPAGTPAQARPAQSPPSLAAAPTGLEAPAPSSVLPSTSSLTSASPAPSSLSPQGSEASPGTAPEKAPRPKVFGTVSFRMSLEKQKNWLSVLERNRKSPIFQESRQLSRSATWGQLRASMQGRPRLEMLREVSRFWNAWPYRSDLELWKKSDYWAIPEEFLRRSGDCEDYCIAKYFTLRELGIPADDMRLVVVTETIRGTPHAVLLVFDGQEAFILDNLTDAVRPMHRVRNYRPHFSLNENGRWMHVKAKPAKASREKENAKKTAR